MLTSFSFFRPNRTKNNITIKSMNISKTSKTFCVVALNANPPILKYFQVTIIIENYAEPPVFEVQVAMDAPPDF